MTNRDWDRLLYVAISSSIYHRWAREKTDRWFGTTTRKELLESLLMYPNDCECKNNHELFEKLEDNCKWKRRRSVMIVVGLKYVRSFEFLLPLPIEIKTFRTEDFLSILIIIAHRSFKTNDTLKWSSTVLLWRTCVANLIGIHRHAFGFDSGNKFHSTTETVKHLNLTILFHITFITTGSGRIRM